MESHCFSAVRKSAISCIILNGVEVQNLTEVRQSTSIGVDYFCLLALLLTFVKDTPR